jgi:inner membrane protein
MEWWMWLALGLALVVAELTVGILAGLDLAGTTWVQWLLFSVLSIAYVLVFRGRLQTKVQIPPPHDVDSLIGNLATVQERLLPGVVGRVEVRGSMWSARNTSQVTLDAGQRARVASVDGLTLTVIPE